MSEETHIDQRFRRYGWMMMGVGGLWFAAMTWLYYNPPENAMQIAVAITNWLPQIAGIKKLSELNIWSEQFGDRIALVLALSYVPMFILGALVLIIERLSGGEVKRMTWSRCIVLMLLATIAVGGCHYWLYWIDLYGRRLSIAHPFLAVTGPYISGFTIFGVITSFKRFKIQ